MKLTIRDTMRSMVRAALRKKGIHTTEEDIEKLVAAGLVSKHLPRVKKEHARRLKFMAKVAKEKSIRKTHKRSPK